MIEFSNIEDALESFAKGNCILVVDDESRENEGDIIFAAQHATQEKINFCATHARGLICIAMSENIAKQIEIVPIESNNKDAFKTAFYTPIDAAQSHGITTGISAKERAITAKLVTNPNVQPSDFITPGHLFPVVAKNDGVLVRAGHTEAAVDLCNITHQPSAAVICEIMNKDGDMMRRDGLYVFAKQHQLPIISIQQIVEYRKKNTTIVTKVSSASLPTQYGNFEAIAYKNNITQHEHLVLLNKESISSKPIVRFHSECLTGDVFGSLKCDCQSQLQSTLSKISENGYGAVIYLRGQEGRGIGLANKIAAYKLQQQGLDTYDANEQLGFPADARSYDDAIAILNDLGMDNFYFVTNNPKKLQAVADAGFEFEQYQIKSSVTKHNKKYLQDKNKIAQHKILEV